MNYLSEQFTDNDRYLALEAFSEGRSFGAWKIFGAHPDTQDSEVGYRFRVWAPNAANVCLTGDFNKWNQGSHPMHRLDGGIWELFVPRLNQYDAYKYAIHSHNGNVVCKADPYAFHSETRPGTASKLYPLGQHHWNDQGWYDYLKTYSPYHSPMNVYECHLGSWRRGGNGEFLDYRTIASYLVPYVKEMGYTHVEFMPVMEHPLDDSWGYQVTGYFSATSRFGTPDDLKYLIDQLHQGGIGVILDWVPAHFPRDAFGLYEFDGTPTYEYDDIRGQHPQWGTNCFDLGRNEVKSFLYSSAMFWLEEFHADGLRVDAVSSMLYLTFGREESEWLPNINGGEENLEAIAFFQELNTQIFQKFPHTLMIAEEATSWPQVTHPVAEGGLGFNFKWNMGWMNDICHYIDLDPLARQHHHKDLTFSMMYAFNENYILPFSHDEVVHEKSSFLGKMAGDTFQKLASSRAFHAYILTHPGKKLTFMGTEIGQWNEWNFAQSMDWHLMEFDDHKRINHFHKKANQLYLSTPALWQQDTSWSGFDWLCADDNLGNTLCYVRWDNQKNPLIVVCNFSPVHREGYRVPLPKDGIWNEVFNTDWLEFGGANHKNQGDLVGESVECYGKSHSIAINLPPNAVVMFSYSEKNETAPVALFDETIHHDPSAQHHSADFSSNETVQWAMAVEQHEKLESLELLPPLHHDWVLETPSTESPPIIPSDDENNASSSENASQNKDSEIKQAETQAETVLQTETVAETQDDVSSSQPSIPFVTTDEKETAPSATQPPKKRTRRTKAELETDVIPDDGGILDEKKPRGRRKKAETVAASGDTTARKRGRPKKLPEPEIEGDDGSEPPKKRGRPKKSDT